VVIQFGYSKPIKFSYLIFNRYLAKLRFARYLLFGKLREKDHPLRPKNYKDISKLWEFNGYKRMNLNIEYEWATMINNLESIKQRNKLELWDKSLELLR